MNLKLCEVETQVDRLSEEKIIKALEHNRIRDYAYIKHDKDENVTPHWHIAIRLKDTYNTKHIAEWFDVPETQIEKVKGRWTDMLKYLIHRNAPEKYQYEESGVKSNFDFQKILKEADNTKQLDEIIEKINAGEIREYNIHSHIDIKTYVRYKRQLSYAFDYTNNKKGVDRQMEAVFITGDSGTGKTTYAKSIAEQKGYSVFVTDSGNNPLDGYGGEDCIILDDLRGSTMKIADLLKLLDNNTACAIAARYRNKNIMWCKLIIITTIHDIDTFFRNVFQEETETAVQLKRRCKYVVHMTKTKMWYEVWSDAEQKYVKTKPIGNIVMEQFQKEYISEEDAVNIVDAFFQIGSETKEMMIEEIKTHQNERFEQLKGFENVTFK